MRKLLIAVVVLLVLAIALVVTAAVFLNRIIAGNQDRIVRQAEAALGRDVSIGSIGVSLWGGIGVRLDDVRIADDARFGSKDFVRVARLTAHAKLWPLLHRILAISRLDFTQPQIRLVRDAAGQWNYAGLRPLAARKTAALTPAVPAPGIIMVANEPLPQPISPALPFAVGRATISDGNLIIIDQTQSPERMTQISHLDVGLGYPGPASPTQVRLAAAVEADTRNVDVQGTVGPWDALTGIPMQLDGALGPWGPQKVRIDAVHVVATVLPEQVRVLQLTGRAFGGSFTLNGQYPLHANAEMALKGEVKDLAINEALQAATHDVAKRIGGKAHLAIDLRGAGATREAIEASLAGTLAIDVQDGVIKDFNIVNEVLGRAKGLPVIGSLVSANTKPKYARLFADPDTHFETLHGTFAVGGQWAQTDDLAIVATDYGVLGRGWVYFNRQSDFAGTLRMSKRFSDDVAADVKEAKYLFDDQGQLTVPFHLQGQLGKAKPTLDTSDIVAILQRGAARGAAKGLLDKLLGGRRQGSTGDTHNLLDQGLRDLFGR